MANTKVPHSSLLFCFLHFCYKQQQTESRSLVNYYCSLKPLISQLAVLTSDSNTTYSAITAVTFLSGTFCYLNSPSWDAASSQCLYPQRHSRFSYLSALFSRCLNKNGFCGGPPLRETKVTVVHLTAEVLYFVSK